MTEVITFNCNMSCSRSKLLRLSNSNKAFIVFKYCASDLGSGSLQNEKNGDARLYKRYTTYISQFFKYQQDSTHHMFAKIM